jgi:hypothetical protein
LNLEQQQLLFTLNLTETELYEIFEECKRILQFNRPCICCKYFSKCIDLRQKADNLSFGRMMKNWK